MNERDFVYWLQGFFELTESKELTPDQVRIIREHLSLVLKKDTKYTIFPSGGESWPEFHDGGWGKVVWSDIQVTC